MYYIYSIYVLYTYILGNWDILSFILVLRNDAYFEADRSCKGSEPWCLDPKKTEKTTGFSTTLQGIVCDVCHLAEMERCGVNMVLNRSFLTYLYNTWKYELIMYDRTVNRYHISILYVFFDVACLHLRILSTEALFLQLL